jgi:hypothetical protein
VSCLARPGVIISGLVRSQPVAFTLLFRTSGLLWIGVAEEWNANFDQIIEEGLHCYLDSELDVKLSPKAALALDEIP